MHQAVRCLLSRRRASWLRQGTEARGHRKLDLAWLLPQLRSTLGNRRMGQVPMASRYSCPGARGMGQGRHDGLTEATPSKESRRTHRYRMHLGRMPRKSRGWRCILSRPPMGNRSKTIENRTSRSSRPEGLMQLSIVFNFAGVFRVAWLFSRPLPAA